LAGLDSAVTAANEQLGFKEQVQRE
jgi:hypothetical protein